MRTEVIGDATLILGDCLEVLPTLGRVDAVVTDPPYGIGFDYASYDDTRENLRRLIAGMFAHRANYARMVILCGPTQIHEYPASDWVSCITWDTTGSFGKYGYSQWTPVLLYGPDLPGFGNVNGLTKTDTYKITGGAGVGFQRDGSDKKHTCPKPLNIMRQTVQRYTATDDAILDPFMGSGTTGVAALQLGRKFIGIELDPGYFDIACKRIEEAWRQPRLFAEPATKPEKPPSLFDEPIAKT
jgi:site-specific DNA-methyltransferase (adenine-specific)